MRVLVIAPVHDTATLMSSFAVKKLTTWMTIKGIKHEVLRGLAANRISVYFNRKVDLVCYYGHGMPDRMGDMWILLKGIIDKKNIHWFKNAIFYAMSCYTAKELGKIAIKEGVRAFFGHTKKFFGFVPSLKHKFFNDWYELVNLIPKELMSGASCFQALNKYEHFANNLYVKYLHQSKTNSELLFNNARYMELYGDSSAKLI